MWRKIIYLSFIFIAHTSYGQDLFDSLDVEDNSSPVTATFKTTRLVNQHTIESLGKRTLDFRISHRFGPANSGGENLWGLDGPANIRLSLEYSPNGRFMFGFGRSSLDKMFDGFLKYRLIRQTENDVFPFSVTILTSAFYTAQKDPNAESNGYNIYSYVTSRYSYCFEVMFARKFSRSFSFQFSPWLVHYNLVEHVDDNNDNFGIAALLRYKFTKRAAITSEYAMRFNKFSSTDDYYNSFSIGYELETGGHVFQIHFTNSLGIVENQFFAKTNTKWNNMGIRLGFNISRVFTL